MSEGPHFEGHKPINERDLLDVLHSENADEALAMKVIEGVLESDSYDQLKKVLGATEGILGFSERMEAVNKLHDAGELDEELYDAVSVAFLEDDARGIHATQVFRAFLARASAIVDQNTGKEIPQDTLQTIQGEIRRLPTEVHNFVRSKFGQIPLRLVEETEERDVTIEKVIQMVTVVFGIEQSEVVRCTAEIYKALRDKAGFTITNRPAGLPLFTFQTMFELTQRMRGLLSSDTSLSPDERKVYSRDTVKLEDFILRFDRDEEKRMKISTQRKNDKKERELKKATGEITAINQEIRGMAEGMTLDDIKRVLRQHRDEVNAELREKARTFNGTSSLPVEGTVAKELLRLDSLSKAIDAEIDGLDNGSQNILTEDKDWTDARMEAHAIMFETIAREYEDYATRLRERLRENGEIIKTIKLKKQKSDDQTQDQTESPRKKTVTVEVIAQAMRKAEDQAQTFYRRAQELREGIHV